MGTFNTTGITHETPLIYDRLGMLMALKEIKAYANSCLDINYGCVNVGTESGDIDIHSAQMDVFIQLPIHNRLYRPLTVAFQKQIIEDRLCDLGKKEIEFLWHNNLKRKCWELEINGFINCNRFVDVIEDIRSYEKCPCPSTFINTCKNLITILKKYALND